MSSNDASDFKKDMSATVQKSKLSLIKKRASRATASGIASSSNLNSSSSIQESSRARREVLGAPHSRGSDSVDSHDQVLVRAVPQQTKLTSSRLPPPSKRQPQEPREKVVATNTAPVSSRSDSTRQEQQQQLDAMSCTPPSVPPPGPTPTVATAKATHPPAGKQSTAARARGGRGAGAAAGGGLRCSVQWVCQECAPPTPACIPVRSESRCLCGHRYKEHRQQAPPPGERIRYERREEGRGGVHRGMGAVLHIHIMSCASCHVMSSVLESDSSV
jgi:hypothetical protein